ncbi:MAG: M60 family metallopeptidase, partial [Planctomycetota bacterium]
MTPLRTAVLVVALACALGKAGADPSISEGLRSIRTGGNPASLVVWGGATPVVVREDSRVMAASGTLGDGRVVALGYTGYLDVDHADTYALLRRSVAWLHTGEGPARVHGVPERRRLVLDIETLFDDRSIAGVDLDDVDVVIGSPQAWAGAGRLDDLRTFVEQGGGLLAMECAWGQLQLGRAASLAELAANVLLADAGIMLTDRAEPSESAHDPRFVALAHPERAMERITSGAIGAEAAFAARALSEAIRTIPHEHFDCWYLWDPRRYDIDHRAIAQRFVDMKDRPLRAEDDPVAYVRLAFDAHQGSTFREHPSHLAFPGAHDLDAQSVPTRIAIDASVPGWHSTGLWARPAYTIRALRTERRADGWRDGFSLQIGCWLDPQDFPERVRFPVGVSSAPFDRRTATLASPIGGPIYVVVPKGAEDFGTVEIEIREAIAMPRFVLGETTLDDWNVMRADPSAPWCELESDHLVFTLPMDMVGSCERPDLVMEHWDRVHEAMHRLQPRSPDHWPDGKYRFVADKRLSWGYMYCPQNAPAVIPTTAADEMVDLAQFDNEGPHELWGHYHEMGHAHQSAPWTFDGTVEVTVNIFTVHALHIVNGYPLDSEHLRTSPATAWRRFEQHRANGAPFEAWKRDPFLALQTYAMLWHEFGFGMYERVFANYREAGFDASRMSEQEKIDRWVIECSFATQRDLVGYFRAWGLPVSGEAERIIPASYPEW